MNMMRFKKRGEGTILGLTLTQLMGLVLFFTVLTGFASGMVRFGGSMFQSDEEQNSKTSYKRLVSSVYALLDNPNFYDSETNIPLYLSDEFIIVGFSTNWPTTAEFKVSEEEDELVYKPVSRCGDFACLCLYKKEDMKTGDATKRDKGLYDCKVFRQNIKFAGLAGDDFSKGAEIEDAVYKPSDDYWIHKHTKQGIPLTKYEFLFIYGTDVIGEKTRNVYLEQWNDIILIANAEKPDIKERYLYFDSLYGDRKNLAVNNFNYLVQKYGECKDKQGVDCDDLKLNLPENMIIYHSILGNLALHYEPDSESYINEELIANDSAEGSANQLSAMSGRYPLISGDIIEFKMINDQLMLRPRCRLDDHIEKDCFCGNSVCEADKTCSQDIDGALLCG